MIDCIEINSYGQKYILPKDFSFYKCIYNESTKKEVDSVCVLIISDITNLKKFLNDFISKNFEAI